MLWEADIDKDSSKSTPNVCWIASCINFIGNNCIMLWQADVDKDGRLTLPEMIENPYVFYSAIFNDDEDEYNDYHDEFR